MGNSRKLLKRKWCAKFIILPSSGQHLALAMYKLYIPVLWRPARRKPQVPPSKHLLQFACKKRWDVMNLVIVVVVKNINIVTEGKYVVFKKDRSYNKTFQIRGC